MGRGTWAQRSGASGRKARGEGGRELKGGITDTVGKGKQEELGEGSTINGMEAQAASPSHEEDGRAAATSGPTTENRQASGRSHHVLVPRVESQVC